MLIPFTRCGRVHRHGVKDGAELQVQIPEAVGSGKVQLSLLFRAVPSHGPLSDINVSVDSNPIIFCPPSPLRLCCVWPQIHEYISHHLFGYPAVRGHPQHHSEVRLAG